MVGKRHGAVFTSSFRTLLSIAKAVEMKACRGPRPFVKPPSGRLPKPKAHGKGKCTILRISSNIDEF